MGAVTQKQISRTSRLRALIPYAFIGLPLGFLLIFMFWPLARQIYLSLTRTRLANPNRSSFVGWRNYERLFDDPVFYTTLKIS